MSQRPEPFVVDVQAWDNTPDYARLWPRAQWRPYYLKLTEGAVIFIPTPTEWDNQNARARMSSAARQAGFRSLYKETTLGGQRGLLFRWEAI
jgi:hypothetical protein